MVPRRREALLTAIAGLALIATAARGACPPTPRAACRSAGKTRLLVDHQINPANNRLQWRWLRGDSTAPGDFGSPAVVTAYSLCAYDAGGLVLAINVPAGGTCGSKPCWSTDGATGFTYRDPQGAAGGARRVQLRSGTAAKSRLRFGAQGTALPDAGLPLAAPVTVQLLRSGGEVCFESVLGPGDIVRNDTSQMSAKQRVGTPVPALGSAGCGQPSSAYPPGLSTPDSLVHGSLTRTFRVYVPPSYPVSGATPTPVVVLLHGGFGSGAQVEGSARITTVADTEGFVAVSPDGVLSPGNIRTWNGGTCCGYAVAANIDDVGFVSALLDHLEARLCIDRRRVYAAGMSNGAIMSYRLACELSSRIRAVGPVAGALGVASCTPARAVPLMHVHGTDDLNVPFGGAVGCGVSGAAFTSVAESVGTLAAAAGCGGNPVTTLVQGDGTCMRQGTCPNGNDVELCTIGGGGHQWPGGTPPLISGLPGCPFGYQSQTFVATQVLWDFFARHPVGHNPQ